MANGPKDDGDRSEAMAEGRKDAPAGGPPRNGQRRWVVPVAGVLLVAVAIWGVMRWRYASSHESTDDAYVAGHLVPVLAKVGGYVKSVGVEENQHVSEGQTLVLVDDVELRQRLDQVEAELAAARAAAGGDGVPGQAESQVEQAQRQGEALGAQIAAAKASASKADRDLERIRGLAEKQIVSQQQLDGAEAAAESARATLRSLEQQRLAARAGVQTAQAGVRQAEARLKAAQAAVENARLQLSHARIGAPVTGVVAKRSAEPGQLLQPGQPVMTVVADSGITVTANFKETQLGDIRPGEAAELKVDAYGGCRARGEVASISGATGSQFSLIPPDNATGNFTKVVQRVPVRIRVSEGCGSDRPLRPGMSVVVHVSTG